MAEMRKLSVIVFEEDVDVVLTSLGKAGTAQIIDLRNRLEKWQGLLVPYDVSMETLTRCSDVLSRILSSLEILGLRSEKSQHIDLRFAKNSTKEVLTLAEQKLAELPAETLRKNAETLSRIDQLIEAFEEKWEGTTDERQSTNGLAARTAAEIEHELAEIEKESGTAALVHRGSLIDKTRSMPIGEKNKLGKRLVELRSLVLDKQAEFRKELLILKEAVEVMREREERMTNAQQKIARSTKTVYFEAWVPRSHVNETIETLKKASENTCLVSEEPTTDEDNAPIIPKLFPSCLAAFEKLVYAFGYPSAGDISPIPIMAITFPILFGIMFADVGQGALFVALGALLTVAKRRVRLRKVGDIQQYLLVSSEMFVLLGISATFFGFVFGEFFGPSGVIHPISLGRIGPFYLGGFEPIHEPMNMLRFAIFVGVIHIGLGLILRFSNEVRHRRYRIAPVPVCWLWLLLGGLFMWAYWGGISSISKWFAEGLPMLAGLVMLPLMLIMVFTSLAEGFMEGVGFSVEVFAETLSHTMSYSRLMALGLIHSAMNHLFLVLGGVQHGHFPLESIPIIAVGTVLVMIIEGLVVFVHTLRLHWVEWFSKFHTGEGIAFKPFTLI